MAEDPQVSPNTLYRVINGQATQPLYQLSPIAVDPRVLPVANAQVLGTQQANGSTSVAIGFVTPNDSNIDHYEVWVQRSAYTGENPFQVASVTKSPATFTVSADQATVVIAFIRTVQKNGLATDLQASPTVTFNVSTTVTSVPAANVTAGTLNAGVIYSGTINCSQLNAGTISVSLGITAGTFTGSTLTLNLNGVTTTVANTSVGGIGVAGVEVQDNTTHDAIIHSSAFLASYNTDPSNNKPRVSLANNGSAGIIKVFDGSGTGSLGGGAQIVLDGSNGHVTIEGTLTVGANQVVTGRQTGPGNAAGFTDATAQTWCNNLLTALRNHGLVT